MTGDREHVEREERRKQLREDTLAAWAEYQDPGQCVSTKEADRRLARLLGFAQPRA